MKFKNLYIELGKTSPKVAELMMTRYSRFFTEDIKIKVGVGRAIRSDWSKKSVKLLAPHLEKKFDDIALIESVNNVKKQYDSQNKKQIDAKTISHVSPLYDKEIINKLEIIYIKQDIKDVIKFCENKGGFPKILESWLKSAEESEKTDRKLKMFKDISESYLKYPERITPTLIINLYQVNLLLKDYITAQTCLYIYYKVYGSTPSIAYLHGSLTRKCVSQMYLTNYHQKDDKIVHPLLENDIANAFFQNLDSALNKFYTADRVELIELDEKVRKTRRAKSKKQTNKPTNLIISSHNNWNFSLNFIKLMTEDDSFVVNSYNFSKISDSLNKKDKSLLLYTPLAMLPIASSQLAEEADPNFSKKCKMADIVFCEWGNEPALFYSRFLPKTTKLIIRIHSYEAFTHWQYGINLAGVDGFIFVSNHIRKIVDSQIKFSERNIPSIVCPNIKNYENFKSAKVDEAKYTLGMAGFSTKNKGLFRSLEILKALVKENEKWILRLAGHDFKEGSSDWQYWLKCQQYIHDNGLEEHVVFDGYQDMSTWLDNIGFILSMSDREGTHEALVEGVISGCIPIIKDWSMVRQFGGVQSLYPFLKDYIYENHLDQQINEENLHQLYAHRMSLSAKMKDMHDQKKCYKQTKDFILRVANEA